jgi:hypothetical protein
LGKESGPMVKCFNVDWNYIGKNQETKNLTITDYIIR